VRHIAVDERFAASELPGDVNGMGGSRAGAPGFAQGWLGLIGAASPVFTLGSCWPGPLTIGVVDVDDLGLRFVLAAQVGVALTAEVERLPHPR
jgi:hypothetical protein